MSKPLISFSLMRNLFVIFLPVWPKILALSPLASWTYSILLILSVIVLPPQHFCNVLSHPKFVPLLFYCSAKFTWTCLNSILNSLCLAPKNGTFAHSWNLSWQNSISHHELICYEGNLCFHSKVKPDRILGCICWVTLRVTFSLVDNFNYISSHLSLFNFHYP